MFEIKNRIFANFAADEWGEVRLRARFSDRIAHHDSAAAISIAHEGL